MTKIVALDTETTSLRHDRRAWEIGAVIRETGKPDAERVWLIDTDHLDLGNADLFSLKVGRFHERHPQMRDGNGIDWALIRDEREALREVEEVTRGAHLVGAVVSFDADVLGTRMRANRICPSWHYHLIDVEALAAGWLHRHAAVLENRQASMDEAAVVRDIARPPWKSDDLSTALGVTISEDERHTALGDARWAMRIYDAVMGRLS
jgi:DNA polymerase III epsilon subunit-like protein